jgi:hypothetical protein
MRVPKKTRLTTKLRCLSIKIVEVFAEFWLNCSQANPVYGIGMSGTTKVYRFRLYDPAAEQFRLSARMATQACIRRIHAQLIRSTEMEIDKRHLDADGMTAIIYADPPATHSPWARPSDQPLYPMFRRISA